jgi:hypothetical protein
MNNPVFLVGVFLMLLGLAAAGLLLWKTLLGFNRVVGMFPAFLITQILLLPPVNKLLAKLMALPLKEVL